jgi:hypothetical protein
LFFGPQRDGQCYIADEWPWSSKKLKICEEIADGWPRPLSDCARNDYWTRQEERLGANFQAVVMPKNTHAF